MSTNERRVGFSGAETVRPEDLTGHGRDTGEPQGARVDVRDFGLVPSADDALLRADTLVLLLAVALLGAEASSGVALQK